MNERKRYFGLLLDKNAGLLILNDYINLHSLSKELYPNLNTHIHIICGSWWSLESPRQIFKLLYIVIRNKILFPKIDFTILCNTKKEHSILRALNVKSIFCNHNCFIDENTFRILTPSVKKYNAVYNAVLNKFKRHTLAKDLDNLALITYNFKNSVYKEELDTVLKNPAWLNYLNPAKPEFLDNQTLVEIYNQSYVGLALSEVEGAMYASCEYLLCGIPVVSTKSKGGRDVFFDNYNSKICQADPKSVSSAVREIKNEKLEPQRIRDNALKIIYQHRASFIKLINSILASKGFHYDIGQNWDSWFINKLRTELYADEIIVSLNQTVNSHSTNSPVI